MIQCAPDAQYEATDLVCPVGFQSCIHPKPFLMHLILLCGVKCLLSAIIYWIYVIRLLMFTEDHAESLH